MKFECILKTSSKSILSSHVVLHLMNAGYKINKQKLSNSDATGNLVEITATSNASLTKEQIYNDLLAIDNCELVNFSVMDEPIRQMPAQNNNESTQNINTSNQKIVLKKIGSNYPKIAELIKDYGKSLDSSSRAFELQSLGEKIGASVYKRSYSLGSPLKLPKTLHRELKPALEEFCRIDMTDKQITLLNCPFCAMHNNEESACEFITGYIKGFLQPNKAVGRVDANEQICGSKTTGECVYTLRY